MGGSGCGHTETRASGRSRVGASLIIVAILLSLIAVDDAEARKRGGARKPRGQARGAKAAAKRKGRGGGGARRRRQANNNNNNQFFRLRDSAAAGNFFIDPVVVDPFGVGDARFSRNVVLVNGVPTVLSSGQINNGQVVNPSLGDPLVTRTNGQVLPGISANGAALDSATNTDIQLMNQRGRE